MKLIDRIITAWKLRKINKIETLDEARVSEINRQFYYLIRNNKNIDIISDYINVYIKRKTALPFKKSSTKEYKRSVERILAALEIIGGMRGTITREHSIEELKRKQSSSPDA